MVIESQSGTNDFMNPIKDLQSEEVQSSLDLSNHEPKEQLFLSLKQDEQKNAEKERLKQNLLEKLHLLMNQGKKYIDDEKLNDWETVEKLIKSDDDTIDVNVDFVDRLVKILRMLDEQEGFQKIKNFVFTDYKSFNDLTNMVIHFSKRGEQYKNEVQGRDCWEGLKLIKDGENFSISDFFEHNKKKD